MQRQELVTKRVKLVEDARGILAKDDASADQIAQANAMLDEAAGIKTHLDAIERAAQLETESRAYAAKFNEGLAAPAQVATPALKSQLRSFFKGEIGDQAQYDVPEFRAVNITTDADGKFAVPTETFVAELTKPMRDLNVMRGLARVYSTDAGTLKLPGHSLLSGVDYDAESAEYNAASLVFTQVEIVAHKLTVAIAITEEMLNDAVFDVEAEIGREIGEAFAAKEDAWFIAANGTNSAYGVTAGAAAGVTAASATAITADELIDLYHALGQPYRPRAAWLMKDDTLKAIAKLTNGNGDYIWRTGLVAGQPDTLIGRPVYTSENMPAATAGNVSVLFGDMSYYAINDRVGLSLLRDPFSRSNYGEIRIVASKRTGGKVRLATAIKKLTQAAG